MGLILCLMLIGSAGAAGARAQSAPPPPPARPPARESATAEAALSALAAGHLPTAYVALEPIVSAAGGPASDRLLRWSARLAQTRILSQLGARLAAVAALPPAPTRARPLAPWAEAAWLLTRADLARAAGHSRDALTAARQAQRLLIRLTPAGHPARAQAWFQVGVAQLLATQIDSALYAAQQARATLALARATGQAARWQTASLAERLALPTPSQLLIINLLTSALGQLPPPGSGADTSLPALTATVAAFLDSVARAGNHRGIDSTQLALVWNLRGMSAANRALVAQGATARAEAARAEAGFQRAEAFARAPTERAKIATALGEFRAGYYGPAAALPAYERALAALLGQPTRQAISKMSRQAISRTPQADSLGAADQDALLYLLEQQAIAYRDLYTETADPRLLDAFVARASRLADVLAYRREQIRLGYATEALNFDAVAVADNYALGVEAAETRYRARGQTADLATAFRITQTAKAWRLLTRVGGERAAAGLRADERLLSRYRRTTAALRRWAEIETLTRTYPALAHDPAFRDAADSTRAVRTALARLTVELRQQYPALYARAFNGTYALSLADAQGSLPADGRTAAIEFLRRTSFEDGSNREWVYAFVIQRTGARLLRLPLPAGIDSLIDALVGALARPGSPAYPALAARAYAQLLAPATAVLAPGVRHLIIAPDGELWRLPFEALLTAPPPGRPDYRTLPYALRRWSFTYAHSLTLRAQAREASAQPDRPARLLALAPFSQAGGAQALPFSGQLLGELARSTAGEFRVGAGASRAALRRGAARAGVIHLATHATADRLDPRASFLALADGPLALTELFGLPLHPRLVVLSACETGVGPIRGESESVTSLSWGFTYAGAGSTLATLWRVDDQATAAELRRFYAHLRAGEAKNEALHHAKLLALDSARTAAEADPFFWAGLVLTGDERPLALAPATAAPRPVGWGRPGPLLAGGLLGAALLLGAGLWWRRRRGP